MFKIAKIVCIALLTGIAITALADKGIGKKNKSKITLNITTNNSLRNSISFNLTTGLKYTGSLLASQQPIGNNNVISNTLLTYQKGNTVYIIPHKQIIAVPDMQQGYTGMKIIIRSH